MKKNCTPYQVCVVKRHGRVERYDGKKVYASCYAAALNSHHTEENAEKVALEVMKKVNQWAKGKKAMSSDDIRAQVLKNISDKDVKLMYRHHRDIS
ncbi:hypothetical protein HYV84_04435 [Candidatus Woesearchaeota archaeon]|nr:hypothetical protein [Candidatus Woesearchaeota archaeon]